MEVTLHQVSRVWATEERESCAHRYLVVETAKGEILKLNLFNWDGEVGDGTWAEASLA